MDHSGIFGTSVYGVGTYVRIGDNQGFENDYRRNNRVVNRMAEKELFGISEQLDTISRQAAINEIRKCRFVVDAIEKIRGLPSAQPERKGKWIEMGTNKDGTYSIRCSKCGGGYKTRGHARSIATKAKYKFCPNCGADMRKDGDRNG